MFFVTLVKISFSESIFTIDGWGFLLAFTAPMWTLTGCAITFIYIVYDMGVFMKLTDDSAAHISEETSGAARAAPIAILVGVAGTSLLGMWLCQCRSCTIFITNSPQNLSYDVFLIGYQCA